MPPKKIIEISDEDIALYINEMKRFAAEARAHKNDPKKILIARLKKLIIACIKDGKSYQSIAKFINEIKYEKVISVSDIKKIAEEVNEKPAEETKATQITNSFSDAMVSEAPQEVPAMPIPNDTTNSNNSIDSVPKGTIRIYDDIDDL